ncbi:MAG: hypothetical protein A2201_08670 [Alicyclobacillus sp. RIFOXYA1_FULL_53_8]|nr:MAG: hypothetical protein A2201_08670 [Alicyclobacillus sp. RIFOXYA1_FULL_53_8]
MVGLALTVLFVRLRGGRRPATGARILLPPVAMSTGFGMFLVPQMRSSAEVAWAAFLLGVFFSYPLILTTHYHISGSQIFVRRSKWFVAILLALFALRVGLHQYVAEYLTVQQTAGAFFVLAFGMILPWRMAMFVRYRKLRTATKDTGPAYPIPEV